MTIEKNKTYKPGFVTLYTDASHCDQKCGYAFWSRSSYGKITLAKECPAEITQINQAEIYAIMQGIHHSLIGWKGKEIKGFYVFSDSTTALHTLKNKYKETNKRGIKINEVTLRLKMAYDKMITDNKLEITYIHKRGHLNPHKSTSNWLNNWCDKQSRKARKALQTKGL